MNHLNLTYIAQDILKILRGAQSEIQSTNARIRLNIFKAKWTQNLTNKDILESLRCLLQLLRRLLPQKNTLRILDTFYKLRGHSKIKFINSDCDQT